MSAELRKLLAGAVRNGAWAAFTDDSGPAPHTNIVSMKARTECELSLPGLHKNDPKVALIVAAANALPSLLDQRDELLDALIELRDASQHDETDAFLAAIAKSEAAIKKATGEAR